MNTILRIVLLTAVLLFSAYLQPDTYAQTKDDSLSDGRDLKSIEDADSSEFMTGDWGGFRSRLIESGITPTIKYYMSVLGNPAGGEKKGVQYAGLLNAFLNFDLEKLLNIKGTRFVVSGSWASGTSLSNRDIGNLFNVSSIFSGQSVRLYQLFLRSDLIEDRLNFAIGRMAVGDKFATSSIFYNYVSLAFNENPVSISINNPGFLSNPQSSWGAWVRGKPSDDIYLMAGAYNSNPDLVRDSAHGVDFSFTEGVIFIGEIGYLYNQNNGSNSKPGSYKIGAYYDTASFKLLDVDSDSTQTKDEGNYGFYAIAEQKVYNESPESEQGLSTWASMVIAPKQDVNTFPFFVSGGFVYEGLFSKRDRDKTAIGVAHGVVSDDLSGKDFELLLEATHIIQITDWLEFQPDVQYVIHPGGSGDIPNALVVGFQLGVDI